MSDHDLMYDETEDTFTRFVGYVGAKTRFDLAITTTNHFFGKKLVYCLQTGRSAILTAEEAEDTEYLCTAFNLPVEEAEELTHFLSANL